MLGSAGGGFLGGDLFLGFQVVADVLLRTVKELLELIGGVRPGRHQLFQAVSLGLQSAGLLAGAGNFVGFQKGHVALDLLGLGSKLLDLPGVDGDLVLVLQAG